MSRKSSSRSFSVLGIHLPVLWQFQWVGWGRALMERQKDSYEFSSVTQLCPTLCDPMNCSTPGFPVHQQLLEPAQTHVHWVGGCFPYHIFNGESTLAHLTELCGNQIHHSVDERIFKGTEVIWLWVLLSLCSLAVIIQVLQSPFLHLQYEGFDPDHLKGPFPPSRRYNSIIKSSLWMVP